MGSAEPESPNVRLVEVDVDTTAYDQGHIPGAVGWNWQTQLQDNVRRDLIDRAALEKLLGESGISNDTTIFSTATTTTGSRPTRSGS